MVSLRIFLLILLTLLCREVATQWSDGESTITWSVARAVVAVLAFGLLHKSLILGLLARNHATLQPPSLLTPRTVDSDATFDIHHAASKIREIVEYLWVGSLPAILLLTGWASCLAHAEQTGASKTILVVCWFLPSLLFVVLLDWTTAQLDEILIEQREPHHSNSPGWQQLLLQKLRSGDFASFMLCVTPLFCIAFFNDLLLALLGDGMSAWSKGAASGCGLLTFVVVGPHVLSLWFGSASNDENLKRRFQGLTQSVGARGVELQVTSPEGRWMGAAIVGWIPGLRHLWLSGWIAETFTAEQTDMVLLHELAHVKRMHFAWRLVPLCAAALLLLPLAASPSAPVTTALVVLAIIVLLAGIRFVAHRCEFDADRYACILAREAGHWQSDVPPEEALSQALALLSDGTSTERHTWLHPSINSRLTRLAP